MMTIYITTDQIDQANLPGFITEMLNHRQLKNSGYAGCIDLYARDVRIFERKFGRKPNSLNELVGQLNQNFGQKPEEYFLGTDRFTDSYFEENGLFVIKKISPVEALLRHIDEQKLGFGMFVLSSNQDTEFNSMGVRKYCLANMTGSEPNKLATNLAGYLASTMAML